MKHQILLLPVWVIILFVSVCAHAAEEPFRLQSIQADFVQEKHMKILAHPIVSTGKLLFQVPASLRWEYQNPVPSLLLMHDGKLKKFIERDGRMVEDQAMRMDAMQMVLSEISNWLDGRFAEGGMFKVKAHDDRNIVLEPKDQAVAGVINRIELKLGEEKGLLDEIILFEGPDSYTAISFSNRVLNRDIAASAFTSK